MFELCSLNVVGKVISLEFHIIENMVLYFLMLILVSALKRLATLIYKI